MNVRRNLVANLLGQGWSALLNLGAVPIYLKLLGVESFGLIGFSAVVLVLASLMDGGMATTLNRTMVHYRAGKAEAQSTFDSLRSAEIAIWSVASAAAFAFVMLSPTLAERLLDANGLTATTVSRALALSIAIALMRVTEGIYRAALLGLDRPIAVNTLSALGATARVLGPLPIILYAHGGVLAYFWTQLATSAISLLAFASLTHLDLEGSTFGRGRFDFGALRDLFGFAGAAFAISSLVALVNQTDKLLVARLTSLESFGYYSAAATVATGIYQLVLPTFQSFYPKLSLLHAVEKRGEFDALLLKMAGVVGFIAGVPVAVILLNAPSVVFAWTGNPLVALRTGPLLFWLCFGTFANGIFHVSLAALLSANRHWIAVISTTVLELALVPLLLLGWRIGGLTGVAAAWSGSMMVWSLVTLVLAGRAVAHTGMISRLILYSLAPFAVALAVAGAVRRWLAYHPRGGQLGEAAFIVLVAGTVTMITAVVLWGAARAMICQRRLST
jgi:O-antigen/teichoic acid export membrane protein